jgi:hypothetical protein
MAHDRSHNICLQVCSVITRVKTSRPNEKLMYVHASHTTSLLHVMNGLASEQARNVHVNILVSSILFWTKEVSTIRRREGEGKRGEIWRRGRQRNTHTCVCVCVCVWMWVCVSVSVCVRARACVCVWMSRCWRYPPTKHFISLVCVHFPLLRFSHLEFHFYGPSSITCTTFLALKVSSHLVFNSYCHSSMMNTDALKISFS